jgi:predicted dehydrogenase
VPLQQITFHSYNLSFTKETWFTELLQNLLVAMKRRLIMDEVRWGIIGCGAVTEVKSGPALNKINHSRLVAVMRRTPEKARDYAVRHNVPQWYTDADQLIQDPEVNAIYIATPPDSHKKYTLQAARAGKPVYVEKPMALNFAECEEMIRACEAANVPLFVAYYRRRLPTFLKVAELLKQHIIGKIKLVMIKLFETPRPKDYDRNNIPWRVRPLISGGGYFVDLGSHQLDILDYLLGPITEAHGIAVNQARLYPAEDTVCASFKFESRVVGTGNWCFTVEEQHKTDIIEINGEKGRIIFPCFDLNQPVILETAQRIREFAFPPPVHVQQPLLEMVVDAFRGKNSCPSTGKSAQRTNWVMDTILMNYSPDS